MDVYPDTRRGSVTAILTVQYGAICYLCIQRTGDTVSEVHPLPRRRDVNTLARDMILRRRRVYSQ